jgi:hypothetical protein
VLFIGPQMEQSGRPACFSGVALMAAGCYGEGNGSWRGCVDSMEKPKVVIRRFDSTPARCGRVSLSDEQRGGVPVGRRQLGAKGGGMRRWGWARWATTFSWALKAGGPECH